jgi:hypothetical protein
MCPDQLADIGCKKKDRLAGQATSCAAELMPPKGAKAKYSDGPGPRLQASISFKVRGSATSARSVPVADLGLDWLDLDAIFEKYSRSAHPQHCQPIGLHKQLSV